MEYRQFIKEMSPDVYARLKRAVELGKWPDGKTLSPEQKASALQAVIAWDEIHLQQRERTGFIDKGRKEGDICDDPQEQLLNWKNPE